MRVYVVRHAAAEEKRAGKPDAARALTPKGRARFAETARGLERLGVRFDRLLHSPKRRAAETADALAALVDGKCAAAPGLARAPDAALLESIRGERVALVGHEPHVSALVAWLVVGAPELGERFGMKKGGVVALEGAMRPGGMRVVAFLPPRVTRKLARR